MNTRLSNRIFGYIFDISKYQDVGVKNEIHDPQSSSSIFRSSSEVMILPIDAG